MPPFDKGKLSHRSPRRAQHGPVATLSVRYLYRDTVVPALRIHPIGQSQRAIAIVAVLARKPGRTLKQEDAEKAEKAMRLSSGLVESHAARHRTEPLRNSSSE